MPTVSSPRFRASASAASILAEPPLVEIPTATSSGLAWAMSWRAKIASVPISLAMAVTLAGSADRETAGIVAKPWGGSTQSETKSFEYSRRYHGEGPCLRFGSRGPQAVHLLHLLEH